MILLSTFLLALACRDNAIVHRSQATATGEVIWPPEDGRIPPDALAPAVLPTTNCCLTACASVALGPTQPLSPPGHRPWLQTPGPENLASRLCPKKGTPGKGNNHIKPQTELYWPPWLSSSESQATDSNRNDQEAFTNPSLLPLADRLPPGQE